MAGMLYEGVRIELHRQDSVIEEWSCFQFIAVDVEGCRFNRVIVQDAIMTKRGRLVSWNKGLNSKEQLQKL